MPIYLVRWPTLTASLVRADDEDELLYLLDQAANPEGCTWSVYDGPLAIDFRLPVEWSVRDERPGEPIAPDQIVIEDLGPLAGDYVVSAMAVGVDRAAEGLRMLDKVLEEAFPNVHAAAECLFSDEGIEECPDGVLPEVSLRNALRADLAPLLGASWRRANLDRKTDRISTIARQLDMPIALVRGLAAEALDADAELHDISADADADAGPDMYVGYFDNEHGEQAEYSYDWRTGEATVRLGGTECETALPVVNGEVAGVAITEAERAWLRACWLATGAAPRQP
jgi:hypothetical protein